MAGTFTCSERIVRDGVLVAYEGQVMTAAEAEALGLAKAAEEPKPDRKAILAEAEALGIEVPARTPTDKVIALIAAAKEQEAEDGESDDFKEPEEELPRSRKPRNSP